MFTSCHRRS